jgi:hypothetical protein
MWMKMESKNGWFRGQQRWAGSDNQQRRWLRRERRGSEEEGNG